MRQWGTEDTRISLNQGAGLELKEEIVLGKIAWPKQKQGAKQAAVNSRLSLPESALSLTIRIIGLSFTLSRNIVRVRRRRFWAVSVKEEISRWELLGHQNDPLEPLARVWSHYAQWLLSMALRSPSRDLIHSQGVRKSGESVATKWPSFCWDLVETWPVDWIVIMVTCGLSRSKLACYISTERLH